MSGPLSGKGTMVVLHNPLSLAVSQEVMRALSTLSDQPLTLDVSRIYASLSTPPKAELGEIAVPCFQIAKELKLPPPLVAEKIAAALKDSHIAAFTNMGPYVNARLSTELLVKHSIHEILSGARFAGNFLVSPPTTMFEFSQPNTHKELHVGHMRNISLGGALAKTATYIGIPVITATFPGDVGTHVAKCLWYLKTRNKEPIPEKNRGQWLGSIYTRATLALEQEENTDQGKANSEALSAILKQLETGSGEYFNLWKETREWSIALMNEAYTWLDVKFDRWYWESELDSPSVTAVKKLYEQGKLEKSDDAIGVDLTEEKLGFCILLKSDGNGLYATKDLLLAQRKFQDYPIDKSVYLVDTRQTFHFQQIFAALKRVGFDHASDCYHLAYNYVRLPDGPMSSRKGNIVPLETLTASMQETIKEQYLSKVPDLSAEEKEEISRTISKGAIKFGMNRVDPNTSIIFELSEWLRLDGDSGPYVQYTGARIRSILRKFEAAQITANPDYSQLTTQAERNLLNLINQANDTAVRVVETLKTNMMCEYLLNVAGAFNTYYAQSKIIAPETPELSAARVRLCEAVLKTLEQGLGCLGIKVPERM
jgi:arginyl-tRNA synthetase